MRSSMQFDSVSSQLVGSVPTELCRFVVCSGTRLPNGNSQGGFSLLETLVVLMLSGVLASIAIGNLRELANPAQSGAAQIEAFLKQVRSIAISQTLAYQVSAESASRLVASFGASCNGTMQTAPGLTLDLPNGTTISPTDFTVCFNSRGIAMDNVSVEISDARGRREVEVLLGGGVRIL
jgi:prepilin-type N-terminal cleavage/methylation domain-containing protein